MVLDYLAYQHADEWTKLGYSVIDVVGNPDFQQPQGKLVAARLIPGWKFEAQIYNDVEGSDPNMIAPKAVREKAPEIKEYATIEEYIKSVNESTAFKPDDPGKRAEDSSSEKETQVDVPQNVDEAFL